MLVLSAPLYFSWVLIIIASISQSQPVEPVRSDETNQSPKLSNDALDAKTDTTEDNGNLTKPTSKPTLDHKMEEVPGIPYKISRQEDVCRGCPENEWRNATVQADWKWIWAENERNYYLRRLHGSRDLIINYKLCKCAQLWADKLLTGEVTGHSGWCFDMPSDGTTTYPMFIATLVDLWYREIEWWNFDKGGSKSPWGWYITGHFVQVVHPQRIYHCNTIAKDGDKWSYNAIYDDPHDEKVDGRKWWIRPPKKLKDLLAGAGTVAGSIQYILFLLIVGAIVVEGTLN